VTVRIGTSGWHYRHWLGPYYPPKLPASQMLEWYTNHFDTVELNNTFYRLPPPNALQTWRETVPPGFRFAMKGSRFITHMKKLKDPVPALAKFFERADLLGRKLGPIVFQLPPNWAPGIERFAEFLDALPRGHRYAFEFRDPRWHTDHVYQLLRKHRAAFCVYDLAGFVSPFMTTTDFAYVRLHGPGAKYQGRYTKDALDEWAERIHSWPVDKAWVYFDNDAEGFAAINARELRERLNTESRGFGRLPEPQLR
jgi:uncharacterized protein YecE (DUF72 family)